MPKGLLCVKSIMTIILSVALVVLTLKNPETYADTFKSCVTMVVTFYFAHQVDKKGDDTRERDRRIETSRED